MYFWVQVLLCGGGGIDPDGGGQAGRLGAFPLEPLWVGDESGLQGFGAFQVHRLGLAEVDGGRGHVADARVAMRLVVPGEELLAMAAGILDAAEAVREIGTVLQRLELGLGIGVVVRDIGPAVGLGDIQVDQQGSHRLTAHAGTPVGMQRQRVRRDVVLGHRFGDQLLGQFGGFLRGDHPADDVAAEDVEDHIQVEAGPFGRAFEFRDVPAPDLVGRGGQEFRLGVDRVDALPSALGRLAVRLQGAVQRAHRNVSMTLRHQAGLFSAVIPHPYYPELAYTAT